MSPVSMRIGYVALDRPDLQRVARELAKGLQIPTMRRWIARYLRGNPRLVLTFAHQSEFRELVKWSDSDCAGCICARKSTSGYVATLCKSVVDTKRAKVYLLLHFRALKQNCSRWFPPHATDLETNL